MVIIPILMQDSSKAIALSRTLLEVGIYAMPIVYPAVDKAAPRLRLFVNALHQPDEIDYTIHKIGQLHRG